MIMSDTNLELGVKLLEFLRDIHEMDTTPESCDVDDLFALLSLYSTGSSRASKGLDMNYAPQQLIKSAPTEADWYWYCGPNFRFPMLRNMLFEVVEVIQRPGHDYLAVQYNELDRKRDFLAVVKMGAQWAGPIPEPIAGME